MSWVCARRRTWACRWTLPATPATAPRALSAITHEQEGGGEAHGAWVMVSLAWRSARRLRAGNSGAQGRRHRGRQIEDGTQAAGGEEQHSTPGAARSSVGRGRPASSARRERSTKTSAPPGRQKRVRASASSSAIVDTHPLVRLFPFRGVTRTVPAARNVSHEPASPGALRTTLEKSSRAEANPPRGGRGRLGELVMVSLGADEEGEPRYPPSSGGARAPAARPNGSRS